MTRLQLERRTVAQHLRAAPRRMRQYYFAARQDGYGFQRAYSLAIIYWRGRKAETYPMSFPVGYVGR